MHGGAAQSDVLVSVVMPCLNEEETIGACVDKARTALERLRVAGEVVVSDNGSSDRSVEIATARGARVVHQPTRGYGAAYLRGLEAARGAIVVIGDSDDTYDFAEIGSFVRPLLDGYEFVNGSRLAGTILPGAMPWSHQHIGNPVISWLLRTLFRAPFTDAYCGMKAFRRELYERIRPRSLGMEFALEMVVNVGLAGLRATEVPIVYHRRGGRSKLRTFRDGARSILFLLSYRLKLGRGRQD